MATTWTGPLYIMKSDGSLVLFVDEDGNIDAPITTTNLTTTGNTILGNAVTDTLTVNGASSITSSSASSLAVGLTGATNPAFVVDSSTASQAAGLKVTGAVAAGTVAVAAISSGADANVSIDAKGTGTITLAGTSTGRVNVNSSLVITSSSANALVLGPNGLTNPVLKINANTASAATGIEILGAAAAGGVNLRAISSATDENLTINAKGSGTITLNPTGTGNIVMSRAVTGVSSSVTGAFTGKSATAVPATAGAVAAGAPLVMNSNGMTIEWTTDAPTHARPKGSLCLNINGSSSSTRLYVNSDGSTAWVAVTTAT